MTKIINKKEEADVLRLIISIDEIDETKNENNLMSKWIDSILGKWIINRQHYQNDKIWRLTDFYLRSEGNREKSFEAQKSEYTFIGFFCDLSNDDVVFKKVEGYRIYNFDFTKYETIEDEEVIKQLDWELAKSLLSGSAVEVSDYYNVEKYF